MNKELYDSFHQLNDMARSEVKHHLKDSPVGLKLFDFLEKGKNRSFRNREVVEFIYKDELQNTEYSILENRYFKLRKKFFEEYFSAPATSEEVLTEEEVLLMRARKLFQQNDREAAYLAWSSLEKSCWEKNIFELLPQIIDSLIFCNQILNKLGRNIELYKRQEEAIVLYADIQKVISLARKIYEINFRQGISHAKAELAEIKDFAQKHKEYPRFEMCYHHVSLYYKLGSSDYIEDMQVISRHFGKFKEYFKLYPNLVLISYRRNYKLHQHMHYKQMSVFYHYNRCEFEDAHRMMKDFWEMVQADKNIYGIYRSESLFFNTINCQRATFRFAEADKTIESYILFLKENKHTSKLVYAYTLKAILYSEAWPNTMGMQIEFLKQKLDEYLKEVKGDNNVQTSYGEVLMHKSKLFFLEKNFESAKKTIVKEEALQYLEKLGVAEIFDGFYNLFYSDHKAKSISAIEINEFRKKLAHTLSLNKLPLAYVQLKWIQRLLENKKFMSR